MWIDPSLPTSATQRLNWQHWNLKTSLNLVSVEAECILNIWNVWDITFLCLAKHALLMVLWIRASLVSNDLEMQEIIANIYSVVCHSCSQTHNDSVCHHPLCSNQCRNKEEFSLCTHSSMIMFSSWPVKASKYIPSANHPVFPLGCKQRTCP